MSRYTFVIFCLLIFGSCKNEVKQSAQPSSQIIETSQTVLDTINKVDTLLTKVSQEVAPIVTEEVKTVVQKTDQKVEIKPTNKPEATQKPKTQNKVAPKEIIESTTSKEKVESNRSGQAIMKFDNDVFNFGTIVEGTVITHKFNFVNVGTSTLEISDTKPSCGCTIASFPFLGIEPGEKGTISMKFDSHHKLGNQDATIEVYSNSKPNPYILKVRGIVDTKVN